MDMNGAVDLFKKANQPKLGAAYGAWENKPEVMHRAFPGGGMLTFDLESLTLQDYDAMRYHPQINASISTLSFMIHQVDWKIECEDQKIATMVEENMRKIWTRLIRSMTQAFWAGFSPSVLEYENDPQGRHVIINKVKDLSPFECAVHWKRNERIINGNRKDFYTYDGIDQAGYGHIPVENCVHPDTPILCDDFVWRPAGSLKVGQGIITFDEEDAGQAGGKGGRQYRTGYIEVNNAQRKESVEVRLDSGDPIIATTDHPFLVRVKATQRGNTRDPLTGRMVEDPLGAVYVDHWEWVEASDLKPGDQVGWFGDPATWAYDDSREAGWLAGMFDGEGCISNGNLSVSQNPGPVLDEMKSLLAEKGFTFTAAPNGDRKIVQLTLCGGVREVARFLAVFRPIRLSLKLHGLLEAKWMKIGKSVDLATVSSVETVGMQPIASIQTSTGTFITGGATSHNTFYYPLLMENGNYSGKKLLKSAFAPWYFSQLMHIYTNRYFERFGEPLPIGRAPFEDEIVEPSGKRYSGKQIMEEVIAGIRSRGSVVLPSDKNGDVNVGGSAYDYDIEYLESQMRGVDFERHLIRLDEEMSLAMFTPLLLLRAADNGSHNLGVQHTQTWLWCVNALVGDMKEYIDRFICDRLKAINFSPLAPPCEWVPRKMGKESTETIRAIITELIRQGRAKPDMEELGMQLGMTVTEVKELTADNPDAPAPDPVSGDTRTRTERDRSRTGTRTAGNETKTPGTRTLTARVRSQAALNWSSGSVQIEPLNGFERSVFGDTIDPIIHALNGLPTEEFDGVDSLMSIFAGSLDRAQQAS